MAYCDIEQLANEILIDFRAQMLIYQINIMVRELINYLLKSFLKTNFQKQIVGQTALHRAINHGYFDIALLLLRYGASFEMNDLKLKSPVQYCCKPKNYVHEQSQIQEQ